MIEGFKGFLVESPLMNRNQTTPNLSLQFGTFHQLYRLKGILIAVGKYIYYFDVI